VITVHIRTVAAQVPTSQHDNGVDWRLSWALRIYASLPSDVGALLTRAERNYMGYARLQATLPEGVTVLRRANDSLELEVAWNPREETADEAYKRGVETFEKAVATLSAHDGPTVAA
jgi:hypothetical protein